MAGTWSDAAAINGNLELGEYYKVKYSFVADASAATIPDKTTNYINALLVGVRGVFGSPAPSGLTISVKDEDGVPLAGPYSLTTTGIIPMSMPEVVKGKLTVSVSGNSTNSAQGKVILLLA